MTPLRWAVGDRCAVDGYVGRISKIVDSQGSRFAKVWREDGVSMFRPLSDLELVMPSEEMAVTAGDEP